MRTGSGRLATPADDSVLQGLSMMTIQDPALAATGDGDFRAYNTLAYEALLDFTGGGPLQVHTQHKFMCECAIPECEDSIHLTLAEYQATIPDDTSRVIAPQHLSGGDSHGHIERHERFWIVRRMRS